MGNRRRPIGSLPSHYYLCQNLPPAWKFVTVKPLPLLFPIIGVPGAPDENLLDQSANPPPLPRSLPLAHNM